MNKAERQSISAISASDSMACADRPEHLAAWLLANDMRLAVGHSFTFKSEPMPWWDGIVHCEVLEIDLRTRLLPLSPPTQHNPPHTQAARAWEGIKGGLNLSSAKRPQERIRLNPIRCCSKHTFEATLYLSSTAGPKN